MIHKYRVTIFPNPKLTMLHTQTLQLWIEYIIKKIQTC